MDVAARKARRVTGLSTLEPLAADALRLRDREWLDMFDSIVAATVELSEAWRRAERGYWRGRLLDPPDVYRGLDR